MSVKKCTLNPVVNMATSLVALLGFAVIIYYIWKEVTEGIFNPSQFFLYFTVQAGLLFTAVQLRYHYAVMKQQPISPLLQWLRFATTLYALVIAPIYWGVVQPYGSWVIRDGWVIIHLVLPIAALLSWLLLPKPEAMRWWWPLAALSYPLLFVAFSELRGLTDGWYPYDFLNHQFGGWAAVGQWVILLTLGIAAIGYILWLTARRRLY